MNIDPRILVGDTVKPHLNKPNSEQDLKKLRESTREFEAIYIQQMYKSMRKTLPEGGLFQKNPAEDMYQEMLDMEMARKTASGKGMGIGEAMYEQLKKLSAPPKLEPDEEHK